MSGGDECGDHDLPPSAKAVLRELEHADRPLSRKELTERSRLAYSTVCDGVDALKADTALIENRFERSEPERFALRRS